MVAGGLEATEHRPFANAEHLGDLAAGQFAVLLKLPRTLGHAGLPDDRRPPDRNRIGFTLAWFPWFRFYGPEKTLFDKAWKLPDIEKVH